MYSKERPESVSLTEMMMMAFQKPLVEEGKSNDLGKQLNILRKHAYRCPLIFMTLTFSKLGFHSLSIWGIACSRL